MSDDYNAAEDPMLQPFTCPNCFTQWGMLAEARGCDVCQRQVCINCIWFHGLGEQLCDTCLKAKMAPRFEIVTASNSVTTQGPVIIAKFTN